MADSHSPFRKFFTKAKDFVRPRGLVKKHQSKSGSSESLPSPLTEQRVSSPFRHINLASSCESFPTSSNRTQLQVEPEEIEGGPRIVENKGTAHTYTQSIGFHPTSSYQSSSTTVISTPWESWNLDRDFLSQVYTWNATHPENTLDRILNKTARSIERHDVLWELVPDGPIPFRGFVKALAHLVKLGTAVAEAQAIAVRFAQDILQWVEKLAAAFGDSEGGLYVAKAWANLADIRKLIEEACAYAHGVLTKIGLAKRISVGNTIQGFQGRFTQAIEHFEVISHIHIAVGQDQLNENLRGLSAGQGHMNQELVTIRKTQENFLQMTQKRQSTLPDTSYIGQKKIPCDAGTRKQVLDEIMNWIFDISEGSPCFFWLSGDPGVGKSAVTASIARECSHRNVLWAQYFINRNDAQTVDPQLYFPSIAKQMSACAPAVDHAVQNTLRDHPYLVNDGISLDQAKKLFVDTIQVAASSTPSKPVTIVIDALDETDVKRLQDTVEIFSQVLADLPHNAKVFISSRVENVIRDHFADLPRIQNIHLSAKSSIPEVTKFMESKVRKIMKDHHLDWSQWGEERMRRLCSQASGLFIWAVTAIEYIRSQIEESGTECFNVVLEELNTNGMDDINVLYRTILRRIYRNETNPWQTQRFQRIIGAILALQSPLSIDDLKGLLDLRNPTTRAPVDVEHFVRRLRTILVPGVDEVSGRTIPRVHKSFADFITGTKAEEFRVDLVVSNGELALRCIDQLERLWDGPDGELPRQLRYAAARWSSHLTRVVGVLVEPAEIEDDSASSDGVHDTASNAQKGASASIVVKPSPTEKRREVTNEDRDLSISVSPDGTRVVYAHHLSIFLRETETGDFIAGPLEGHTDVVNLVVFSPDGSYVVSSSDDTTIRIWESRTGKSAGTLHGHTDVVWTAVFSPDGTKIVSASNDQTIRIWDLRTTADVRIFHGHRGTVSSALFSPDASHIVSCSHDKTVCVWNTTTGKVVHILEGHISKVLSAFFSPDGKYIISRGNNVNDTIIAWDLETGQRVPDYYTDSTFIVAKLSFTTSGATPVITPPKPKTVDEDVAQSLFCFLVGVGGAAGGVSNAWMYANADKRLEMGMYSGQLIMAFDWSCELDLLNAFFRNS